MKLTVLGAGTCLPVEGYSPAGYLVGTSTAVLLVDAGPGTLGRMQRAGVSYRDLDYVLLSHLHSDHALDLATLLQASNATPGWQRSRPLHVIGSEALQGFLAQLMALFDGTRPEGYELLVHSLAGGPFSAPGWSVRACPTGHTSDSMALRIESGGRTLVYTGDAAPGEALLELARGADLLLCECSFPEGWVTTDHLTAGDAGRLAQASHAGRLVLTHLYPPAIQADLLEQAGRFFHGTVSTAFDGWVTEI